MLGPNTLPLTPEDIEEQKKHETLDVHSVISVNSVLAGFLREEPYHVQRRRDLFMATLSSVMGTTLIIEAINNPTAYLAYSLTGAGLMSVSVYKLVLSARDSDIVELQPTRGFYYLPRNVNDRRIWLSIAGAFWLLGSATLLLDISPEANIALPAICATLSLGLCYTASAPSRAEIMESAQVLAL